MSDIWEAVENRKNKLLQKMESASASEKTAIQEDVAACYSLLGKLWRTRRLPSRPPTEEERGAVDNIVSILDRLPPG